MTTNHFEVRDVHLGPPVVPFYRFFFGGRVPLLKSTTGKKGTLVLTSLLEDLVISSPHSRTFWGGLQAGTGEHPPGGGGSG